MSAAAMSLVVLMGCRDGGAREPFVRLSGAIPAMVALPPAPAHLIAFWATWCPPCREETEQLTRLARNPIDGLAVVVVSEDETMEVVRRFFGGLPPPELNFRMDDSGRLAREFRVQTLPAAVLVRDGQRVARFDGPRSWDAAVRPTLRRLLAEEMPRR